VCVCVSVCLEAEYDKNSPTWLALARIAMLCNRAEFRQGEEQKPVLRRCCPTSLCFSLVSMPLSLPLLAAESKSSKTRKGTL